jgi:hypothetical protein
MGLLRGRASRQRRAQRHRAGVGGVDSANDANPSLSRSMARHGAGDTGKKTMRKAVVYGIVFCVMQYMKRKNKGGEDVLPEGPMIIQQSILPSSGGGDDTSTNKGMLFVMDNVLPLEVAKRWRKTMRFEWHKAQNGAWEYCSTSTSKHARQTGATESDSPLPPLECHKNHITERNNTVHSSLLSNKQGDDTKLLQSEWRIPSDHYHSKAMQNTFWGRHSDQTKGVLHERLKQKLTEMLYVESHSDNHQDNLHFEPLEFTMSHFTTGDFRQNAKLLVVKPKTPTVTTQASTLVSFVIFLNEDEVEQMSSNAEEENDSGETSPAVSEFGKEYGGLVTSLICARDDAETKHGVELESEFEGDSSILHHQDCQNKEELEIRLNFNEAAFWSGTSEDLKWNLSPVSWLAEEHGYRVFAVTGSFYSHFGLPVHTGEAEKPIESWTEL